MIWSFASIFAKGKNVDNHNGFGNVLTHENAVHLYKSPDAPYVLMRQLTDYTSLGFLTAFLTGVNPFIVMPLFLVAIQMPRKISTMQYFTWNAELLPHTEQVIFSKASLFGQVERHYVNIRDLEKIDADQV